MKNNDSTPKYIAEIKPAAKKTTLIPETQKMIRDTAVEVAPELIGEAGKMIVETEKMIVETEKMFGQTLEKMIENQQKEETEQYKQKCESTVDIVHATYGDLDKIPEEKRVEVAMNVTDQAFNAINKNTSIIDKILNIFKGK